MKTLLPPLLTTLAGLLRSRGLLHLEILSLRQQLATVTARDHKQLLSDLPVREESAQLKGFPEPIRFLRIDAGVLARRRRPG